MPAQVVTLNEINQFLPLNKYQVDNLGDVADLHRSAISIVFGYLKGTYNVSTWTDSTTTPPLVKTIISLWLAGNVYNRQFAEEETRGLPYGQRRINEAYALLNAILEGVYDIGEQVIVDPSRLPSVFEVDPVFEMEQGF
jgi:hypothetical protein